MALSLAHTIAAMERLARVKSADFIQWEINMRASRSISNRCAQVLTCACFITLSALCQADSDKDPWERIN